jgi:GT2 family glycosyltransferase
MWISREVFEETGGFTDAFFFSFEDLDFCLRARRAGFKTLWVPQAAAVHEGSLSIGRHSADRLYYATRNHLLLAREHGPRPAWSQPLREGNVCLLNLAHCLRQSEVPRPAALVGWMQGIYDHWRQSYGPAPAK